MNFLISFLLSLCRANLSNDYFTNRQDRYIVFRNCKPLCDYFDELVETISTFSFQLSPNDTVAMRQDFKSHPYLKSSKIDFNKEAGSLLKSFMKKYVTVGDCSRVIDNDGDTYAREIFCAESINKLRESTTRSVNSSSALSSQSTSCQSQKNNIQTPSKTTSNPTSCTIQTSHSSSSNLSCSSETIDTLIFPLLQMKTMGIDQDEIVTSNILGTAPKDASMVLATAYFNLTDGYWEALCGNYCKDNHLIMAHPKAMGFYNASGMAGKISNIIPDFIHKVLKDKNNTVKHRF